MISNYPTYAKYDIFGQRIYYEKILTFRHIHEINRFMGKQRFSHIAVKVSSPVSSQTDSRRHQSVHIKKSNACATIEMIDGYGSTIPFDNYDLNAVGVYLYSDYLLCVGEKLDLKVSLPSGKTPLRITGEVVHANAGDNPGMGVAFRRLSVMDKQQLQNYVAQRFLRHVKSR